VLLLATRVECGGDRRFLSSLNNDAMRFGPRSPHKTTTTDPSKLARRSSMLIYTAEEINNPARFQ
jgi:hypothetical protein